MKRIFFCLLPLIILSTILPAEQQIALVIGNASYKTSPLRNPSNDAEDMSAALKDLDFTVTTLIDATNQQMYQAIRDFGKDLTRADVGLFYYAGHGMQVDGINYLIPVGADIQAEVEVRFNAIDANLVLSVMERAGTGTNILLLDACRDNPFARSFRSSSRGLAVMDAPSGSLIVYATAPGSVAADGAGRNGIFTGAFLRNMKKPGVDVEDMLRDVRKEVMAETANEQVPWSASSLIASFYFRGESAVVETEEARTPVFSVEKAYGSVEVGVNTAGMLFLDNVKQGQVPSGGSARLTNLEVGRHSLEMRYENGHREELSVTVEKDKTVQVAFSYVELLKVPEGFVLVEAGTFRMGSFDGEKDEKLVHIVTISKSFYLSKYEVTQKLWREVMGTDPSHFKGDNLPVEKVSWYDVVEYCNRLSKKEGLAPVYRINEENVTWDLSANGYRLPTEAEWEYAARGGNKSRGYTYAGSNTSEDVAWHSSATSGGWNPPQKVGLKNPNELGLYDMSGNVLEWCWDWYDENYYGSSPASDPRGPSGGSYRVSRGGSYRSDNWSQRVADRDSYAPSPGRPYIGFRPVRTAE